ncbi:MAG: ATP-binding protein [Bacteroidota bacterium]
MHQLLKKHYWLQIALPVLLASLATWITLHPLVEVSYRTPYLMFFGVIFISSAYGGSRSSIIATVSCVLLSFLFIQPKYQPQSEIFGVANFIFLAEGLLLSGLFRRIEKIQQKLSESEQRFRGIIEKSAEGMLMTDQNGQISYLSPSVNILLGAQSGELVGTSIQSLLHPDERVAFDIQLEQLLKQEISEMEFLTRIKAKSGGWIWIEGTVMDLRKEQSISSLVFQYRDVTNRIELELQKEDFVQITSHELKTPVTSIKGFIQVLKKRHQKEEREQDIKIIERIENQSERLVHLIEDLLDVTRIKNGELPYHFSYLDLTTYLPEVIAAHEAIHQEHTFNFSTFGPALVYADKDRIAQVISNLLNNAIKYSPGKTTVEIKLSLEDGHIKTSITDQGIGIPAAQQERIFERFYRVSTLPKDAVNGLGIGLYISNEIVKRHGGEIAVSSKEGQGSEFWFRLAAG